MSEHRYPTDSLTGDYLRAAAGIIFCGGPLVLVDVGFWPLIILGALTILFAYFGWRTWVRHTMLLTVDESGLTTRSIKPPHLPGQAASLQWPDLQRFKLSYFSTRRDKSGGWMQLTLANQQRKFQIDSAIDGFEDIARHAFQAAHQNGVQLSDTTLGNLGALGLEQSPDSGGWGNPATWDTPPDAEPSNGSKP